MFVSPRPGRTTPLASTDDSNARTPVVPTTTTLPPSHDLAITKLKAPKRITLSNKKPAVTKELKVAIVNRGSNTETIDQTEFENLIRIEWTSLMGALCPDPATVLELPKKGFPVVLATKKKLSVRYEVTWSCANDGEKSTKTEDHSDFEATVTIDPSVLGGGGDSNPSDNVCPRPASGDDKGCGPKKGGVGGRPIRTDVVVE